MEANIKEIHGAVRCPFCGSSSNFYTYNMTDPVELRCEKCFKYFQIVLTGKKIRGLALCPVCNEEWPFKLGKSEVYCFNCFNWFEVKYES